MENPPNDDGHLTERPVDRRTRKALKVQSFKPKSSMFSFLRIGNYQIQSQNTLHLTAKWYYLSKQLTWEILENGRMKKITIGWSDISAMRVRYGSNPEILEIELSRPPFFYSEDELRPGICSSWIPCSDFTDGQASASRIHHLEFPHGMLESRMEPLFFLDHRLRDSTGRPFPSLESPFFIAGGREAPPPPLISSQLLPHHQTPPGHSRIPAFSSNSNVMNSISTGSQSANYGYPQPSPSLPRSGRIQDQELSMGHWDHYLEFPPGIPKRRMEPLFILDHRLRNSTGRPFPSLESPFFFAGGHQAPPLPPPLISSQLLPHQQTPSGHSRTPTFSSNSNNMNSISTGPANYGYPQPSPSLPRSGRIQDQELSMEDWAQNATFSSYSHPNNTRHGPEGTHLVDMGHHSGLTSSSNYHQDLVRGPPSSSSFNRSDDEKDNECRHLF